MRRVGGRGPLCQATGVCATPGRGIHRGARRPCGAGLIRVIRPPGPAYPAGELAHQHQGGGQDAERGS